MVISARPKASSPNLLATPTRQRENRRDWRNRNKGADSKLIHLAESRSHQEWLEASLKRRQADAESDKPRYAPFMEKRREQLQTPEGGARHQAWIEEQLAIAIRVRGEAARQKAGYELKCR